MMGEARVDKDASIKISKLNNARLFFAELCLRKEKRSWSLRAACCDRGRRDALAGMVREDCSPDLTVERGLQ